MTIQENNTEKITELVKKRNWFKRIIRAFFLKIFLVIEKKMLENIIKEIEKERENFKFKIYEAKLPAEKANTITHNYDILLNTIKKIHESWGIIKKFAKAEGKESRYEEIRPLIPEFSKCISAYYEIINQSIETDFVYLLPRDVRDIVRILEEKGLAKVIICNSVLENNKDLKTHEVFEVTKNLNLEENEVGVIKAMICDSILKKNLDEFEKFVNIFHLRRNKAKDLNFIYDVGILVEKLFENGTAGEKFVEVLLNKEMIDLGKRIGSGSNTEKTVGELITEKLPNLLPKVNEKKLQKELINAYIRHDLEGFTKIANDKDMEHLDFYINKEMLGERYNMGKGKSLISLIVDNDGYYGQMEYLEALLNTGKVDLGKRAYTYEDNMQDKRTIKEVIDRYCDNIPAEKDKDKLKTILQTEQINKAVGANLPEKSTTNNVQKNNVQKNNVQKSM